MGKQFEFKCNKLMECIHKIDKESQLVIDEIIERYSPIQKGEDVLTVYFGKEKILKVTKITLCAQSSWGWPKFPLSFEYEGKLLTKSGDVMKKRKPVHFRSFIKYGKTINMPSYNRVRLRSARMHYETE